MSPFESFLSALVSRFEDAERISTLRRRLSFAGRSISLGFSSAALQERLFESFEHLEIKAGAAEGDKPAFSIFACDRGALSGRASDWEELEHLASDGERLLSYNVGPIHALYNPVGKIFSLADLASRKGWYCVPSAEDLPFHEIAAPMRMILHWSCEGSGSVLVHAAGVGNGSGAVLLAGSGGSGKSTTAMMAVCRGLRYLGDDYVLLGEAEAPKIYSAYGSLKFRWDAVDRIPEAAALAVNDRAQEKGYCFLHRAYPEALSAEGLSLRAVLLPEIARRGETGISRLPSAKGLLGLAASTIFQMPGSGATTLKNLASILKGAPIYRISLGSDDGHIIGAIHNALAAEGQQ